MSKKMKFYSYEDARARSKHQTLLQDYMELQQETEVARNNIMALKQKKQTLQAEVRFLRRRRKFLLKDKSSALQEQVLVNPKPTRFRKSNKDKVRIEKQRTLHNLPPARKKKAPQTQSILPPEFGLILENQQSVQRVIANQRVRINGPKASPLLDRGQKHDIFGGQTRKPVIDLNQIFREEDESEEQCESLMNGLMRNGGKRKVSWQDPVVVSV